MEFVILLNGLVKKIFVKVMRSNIMGSVKKRKYFSQIFQICKVQFASLCHISAQSCVDLSVRSKWSAGFRRVGARSNISEIV